MVNIHEGTGGLLEQFLAIKKQELPKLTSLLRHQRPSPHRYPFTRGTGNYLNALLDAHILEPSKDWLLQAEKVLAATFHPADCIGQRNLLDVETGWHYLILLTSLGRYILIKGESGAYDETYKYALASFRHYTRWMLDNEQPFLTNPEQLEFANHTWVAQDIRKAMLMHQACVLDPVHRPRYKIKADEWFHYVVDTLSASQERHFSRILVILLQNYGPHHVPAGLPPEALGTEMVDIHRTIAPKLTVLTLINRIAGRLLKGLASFRPSRERAWLNSRLER
jgi:hypothetical protein